MIAKTENSIGETVRQRFYLYPGQLYASAEPTTVTTILGSCVAVCLWDAKRCIGGLNHFLLPHWVGNGLASPRFGNVAVGSLIEQLSHLDSPPGRHERERLRLERELADIESQNRHYAQRYLDVE